MQKYIPLIVLMLVSTLLSGCRGGNASEVQVITGETVIFSHREIEQAMETAMNHFRREFSGCTMTRIEYNEDTRVEAEEWANIYQTEEAIVLTSSFNVDASGGDGSLNPNSTYNNWKWVLTRDNGGDWVLRTWGYG